MAHDCAISRWHRYHDKLFEFCNFANLKRSPPCHMHGLLLSISWLKVQSGGSLIALTWLGVLLLVFWHFETVLDRWIFSTDKFDWIVISQHCISLEICYCAQFLLNSSPVSLISSPLFTVEATENTFTFTSAASWLILGQKTVFWKCAVGARMHGQCPPSCSARGFQGQTAPAALLLHQLQVARQNRGNLWDSWRTAKHSAGRYLSQPNPEICKRMKPGNLLLCMFGPKCISLIICRTPLTFQVFSRREFQQWSHQLWSRALLFYIFCCCEKQTFMGQHLLQVFDGNHPISQSRLRQEGLSTYMICGTHHADQYHFKSSRKTGQTAQHNMTQMKQYRLRLWKW